MHLSSLDDDSVDLMDELRKLRAKEKRSKLQLRYYAYLKEPKPIDKLPKVSLRGDNLPKKQLRRFIKKWQKRLGLERYLVIIEEVSEWDYDNLEVELGTRAKLWVIDKNGERVKTESPIIQLDSKRVEAGDFVLIYIMFYLSLWPSHSSKAYEDAVLHEFMHVRYPSKTEKWMYQKTSELLRK